MITIIRSSPFLIKKKETWYADKPKISGFFNTFYITPLYHKPVLGFKRITHYTTIIKLTDFDETSLLHSFAKNTTYEIKRAMKEAISFEIETSLDTFLNFYNSFARGKGLKELGVDMRDYGNQLLITKAVYDNEPLVMHSYIYDNTFKRVRLLHSASLFRNEHDNNKRSLIGRANRHLHYKDMLFFLEKNYKAYDLGGYAFGTDDPQRIKINEFKDSFRGNLVCEKNYYPAWKYLYDRLKGVSKLRYARK